MKLYISDLHMFHENLLTKLDKRNFESLDQMHEYIIEKWNNKVKGGDQVIVLGDFFWINDAYKINSILRRLKGQICLIEGNHDKRWIRNTEVDISRFEWIKPYAELNDHGYNVILSHYPTFCYNHQYLLDKEGNPKTFMLYGHVHNSHDEILINKFINITRSTTIENPLTTREIPCNMINCFCMFSDYTPLSLEEWIEVDEKRRKAINDLSL